MNNKTSFKELVVWQKGVELAKEMYRTAQLLPNHELFGLRSQMCRAAVSIPSNIAEGQKRKTMKDFEQFLRIAYGSTAELETQIIIAESVYPDISFSRTKELLEEIQRMIPALIRKLQPSPAINY
ncbi:four helix bundle protein [Candidatus Kaiserbacteria bacterium]|nr:four helix bundle protein [Candidatus Kaiserbacteria bacterium]